MSMKRVRRLEGVGAVYEGDAVITPSAQYRIDVYQELQEGSTQDGPFKIPGLLSAMGVIDHPLPIGRPFKLVTAQYSMDFYVKDNKGTIDVSGPILDSKGSPLA